MKYLITIACTTLFLFATAQKTETYYDYYWKPCTSENARFYSTLEKTDSGWFRNDYYLGTMKLQMQALYEGRDCKIQTGYCKYFYANGYPSVIGRMVHNKQEGVCINYYPNGMMADSALYHNGVVVGDRIMWHRNGYISDSIHHANDSMDVHISWFDDGTLAAAGYLLNGKKFGKWKFYHRNGNLSGEEICNHGVAASKMYYNEDGTPQPDTAKANSEAGFKKGGGDGWIKYLENNLHWPANYKISNASSVTVGIDFTINEEGKPEDVEVAIPFHEEFDKIAVYIISNCPSWKPAMAHNRKVKTRLRQPVTFQQEE